MARADLRDQAQGFGLLSDATRLGILAVLAKGTSNVTDLRKVLKRKQPGVSHHLGLLRMAGWSAAYARARPGFGQGDGDCGEVR